MDWILDNLQIVGALVVAAAYWLNQAREAKAAEKERQRRAAEGLPDEDDAEFFEEPEEIDPELREERPRRQAPPPLVRVEPPPLPGPRAMPTGLAGELQRQEDLVDRLRQVRKERNQSPASGAAATQKRVAAKRKPAADAVPVDLRTRLRNRQEVRRAVVMREILGPPLGLK